MPSQLPRAAPYFCIASSMYSEQVGLYMHESGKMGDTYRWYPRTMRMSARATRLLF